MISLFIMTNVSSIHNIDDSAKQISNGSAKQMSDVELFVPLDSSEKEKNEKFPETICDNDKTSNKFTVKQKMSLCMLALVEFISYCSMSIMAPFYPKEAADKGMSESMAGFVFSFYAFIIFISSPIFGKLCPKIGVKRLFIGGILVSGICSIMFGTLNYISDYNLFTTLSFGIRGAEALGASAYSTAGYVLIIDIFPNNGGIVRGVLETFVGLGLSTGPAIGGLLFAKDWRLWLAILRGWRSYIVDCSSKFTGFAANSREQPPMCRKWLLQENT